MSMMAVTLPANATTPIGSATVYSEIPIGQITITYSSSNAAGLNLQFVRNGSTIQTNSLSTSPTGTVTDNTQLPADQNNTISVNAVNETALPVNGQFNVMVSTQSI